jgi:hypothetical protein
MVVYWTYRPTYLHILVLEYPLTYLLYLPTLIPPRTETTPLPTLPTAWPVSFPAALVMPETA